MFQDKSFSILEFHISPLFILNRIIVLIFCILDLILIWFIYACTPLIFSESDEAVEYLDWPWQKKVT